MDTQPYWIASATLPTYGPPPGDLEVDTLVIGGGLTGLTTAYLLVKAGHTVAVLERGRCAQVDTGHTTAHLTAVTDLRLYELIETFGEKAARDVWDAGMAAIERIAAIVEEEGIACDFLWEPGYLHTPVENSTADDVEELSKEASAAAHLGIPTEWVERIPHLGLPGLKFPHQALFHPRKYLAGLLRAIEQGGGLIFENTTAEEITGDPLVVSAGGHRLRARYLVVATHTPLQGKAGTLSALLFQTKLSLYTTYALGAKLPAGLVPAGLYWDTADPYNYLRVERREGAAYAIFGGEDHKTGQEPATAAAFRRLEERFLRLVPQAQVDYRWSGQVVETNDGLPYIGETAENQFVGTGFSGNGMTFGTLTAMMALAAAEGREHRWSKLFDAHRRKWLGGTWTYLQENKDFPWQLLRDWLALGERAPLVLPECGSGCILKVGRKRVAAYRDANGGITLRSAVCPHLKCIVGWNEAEHTWDCPCHGSRFQPTGEVISGPAEDSLAPITFDDAER